MEKRAYLYGVSDYEFLAPLNYAHQDAEAVADELKNSYGFKENDIVLKTCARATSVERPNTKDSILGSLRWDQNLDLLVVGFWGHGVVLNGERYLCPMSAKSEQIKETAVALSDVLEAVGKIPAKNVCIILDCCQSRLEKGKGPEDAPVFEEGELKRLETQADQIFSRDIQMRAEKNSKSTPQRITQTVAILNACSDGERAYEW
ncbi:MAG: caspase family protein, partial [Planctomycetia bacterium]|nr:caspase family protein [Planctomycetia bacterium]